MGVSEKRQHFLFGAEYPFNIIYKNNIEYIIIEN